MLDLSLLEALIHASLDLLAKRVHLVSLSLNQGSLRSYDLLVSLLHVALSFLVLHLLSLNLDHVSISILLLPRQVALNLLKVKELS
jgi:hypothetical protein